MTQAERKRFIILFIVLVVLIAAGVIIGRLRRQGQVGADTLGLIQNAAVATYKSTDGIELNSVSNVSEINVSSGVTNLTVNYNLGGYKNKNSKFDVQFFNSESGELLTTIRNLDGQQGLLKVTVKNIPNGVYDIAVKPNDFLSQSKKSVTYVNGQATVIDFEQPFKWGDINKNLHDNDINSADWGVLVLAWGSDDKTADYNGDGVVNSLDAGQILRNWKTAGDKFQTDATDTTTPSAPPVN